MCFARYMSEIIECLLGKALLCGIHRKLYKLFGFVRVEILAAHAKDATHDDGFIVFIKLQSRADFVGHVAAVSAV
ncbi:hypothetical protein D3C75_1134600 [compost metagenome]